MKHLHIRNLKKYQDGYEDRRHIWAKIHIEMVMGDPDCEMIRSEIDWARLIKFIVMETCSRKPIPLDEEFLRRRGFDFKKRSLEETLTQISHFIDVTEDNDSRNETVTESSPRIEKNRIEKNREDIAVTDKIRNSQPATDFLQTLKANQAYQGINIDLELSKMDAWLAARPGRKKTKKFIVNWLNRIDQGLKTGDQKYENLMARLAK